MNRIEKIYHQIKANERTYRDIQLEKILGGDDEEIKTSNQNFIDEIRDYFTTIISRHKFITDEYFIDISQFDNLGTCNCKVRNDGEEEFVEFMRVLYSSYRHYEDFKLSSILTEQFMSKVI